MLSFSIPPRRAAWIILTLVTAIYLAENLQWLSALGPTLGTYIVRPLLWVAVTFIVIAFPRYQPLGKYRSRNDAIQMAAVIGFVQVMLYVIGGLFSGFGKSPSSFALLGIIRNIFLVSATLVGMEFSRAWLVNHLGKKRTFLALGFVALLYAVISIPLQQFTGIRLEVRSIDFLASTLIPALAESLLASFLALTAGPPASIAYRGMLEAFWWFCPILPDLSFAFKGLIGTGVPIVAIAMMLNLFPLPSRRARVRRAEQSSPAGWIMTAVISVMIIWFAVGLFPIRPTVIFSGSMEPALEVGDIVLVVSTSTDKLQTGDIIEYREADHIKVVHRIIEVLETEGKKAFITKGDANDIPDSDAVIPDNVVGEVFLTVPKVGWISVFFKGFFSPQTQ